MTVSTAARTETSYRALAKKRSPTLKGAQKLQSLRHPIRQYKKRDRIRVDATSLQVGSNRFFRINRPSGFQPHADTGWRYAASVEGFLHRFKHVELELPIVARVAPQTHAQIH